MFDTIVAPATAIGEGSVGIIRISGKRSLEILNNIFKYKGEKIKNRYMHYGHIIGKDGKIVDEVMAVYFKAPNTYTAEELVEIHCHGGVVAIYSIIKLILENGARTAQPGEFTKRAFLNGRIDLSQSEAIMDIVSAKTNSGMDIALKQLDGSISGRINKFRSDLIDLIGRLEVSIDYPEEDIEEITYDKCRLLTKDLIDKIDAILETSAGGRVIREGISMAIVGRPNVGKSSLLNKLTRENRAIVTDIAGTTRDIIEEYLNIKGIGVRVLDTAGIRETHDTVERIGVDKSLEAIEKADIVLLMINASDGIVKEDLNIIEKIRHKKVVVIINKVDIGINVKIEEIESILDHEKCLFTSMKSDDAVDELERCIFGMITGGIAIGKGVAESIASIAVSNARHINLLENTRSSLYDALNGIEQGMAYDFLQVDLKNAYEYLGEITGQNAGETLLDNIFSRFCLGK